MNDMNKNVLEVLQREGYFFKESAISEIECLRIKDYLENKESPAKIPFSKVAWGYGNLIEDENLIKHASTRVEIYQHARCI